MALYTVSVQATYGGQQIANVFGMGSDTVDAPETPAAAQVIADLVGPAFVTHIGAQQTSNLTYQKCVVRGAVNASVVAEKTLGQNGGASGTLGLPGFVVIKAKVVSGTLGRNGVGRMGFSGINETQTDGPNPNQITPATIAVWQTNVDAFLAAVNAGTSSMVVISRKGSTPLVKVVNGSNVTSIQVQSGLGSRLSRLR